MMRALISLPPAEILFILKERRLTGLWGHQHGLSGLLRMSMLLVGVEVGAWELAASIRDCLFFTFDAPSTEGRSRCVSRVPSTAELLVMLSVFFFLFFANNHSQW